MKTIKLLQLTVAIQMGLASSIVIADSSANKSPADQSYSPYAS
ncbi:MAG: hypothetical protein ACI9LG_001128 [Moritella dasanensis]|jgi:hypothetical protein